MNSIIEALMSPTAQVLTRTLFHSLWQSAGILIVLLFILRVIPAKYSTVRYLVSYGSIFILIITSSITFVGCWQDTQSLPAMRTTSEFEIPMVPTTGEVATRDASLFDHLNRWISDLTPYIIPIWIVGLVVFAFRLIGSWWFVHSLKKHAHPADTYLIEKMRHLKNVLKVTRRISLAESWHVHAPIVIGFFKPMLLLPVGFASGLTTEQVEAIFIHELTHIKREDYLLNLLQSVVEAVFFFNPFVWMISSIIRREREHCCDDAVVVSGRNALAYVKALAYMEEQRSIQSTLALSAIGTKNQLLQRIKRLMEKSVQQYSWREKLVPLILLALGISLASWATIVRHDQPESASGMIPTFVADTTIKKKTRGATVQRKKSVTTSPGEMAGEESEANDSRDEDMGEIIVNFEMPAPPAIVMPPIPNLDIIAPPSLDGIFIDIDSLPRIARFDAKQWQQFQAEFQTRFQEQFGDFYKKHEAEFEKMMREMEFDFKERFKDDWTINLDKMQELQAHHFKIQEDQLRLSEDMLKINEERLKEIEQSMAERATHFEQIDDQLKALEKKMNAFHNELAEMLRLDGYLGSDESVRNMRWDNGRVEINGKEIRKEDIEKYENLHIKHFGEKPGQLHFSK